MCAIVILLKQKPVGMRVEPTTDCSHGVYALLCCCSKDATLRRHTLNRPQRRQQGEAPAHVDNPGFQPGGAGDEKGGVSGYLDVGSTPVYGGPYASPDNQGYAIVETQPSVSRCDNRRVCTTCLA